MRSYLLTLAFTATVAAHGHVLGITADQKYYQGYTPNFQYMKPRPKVPAWTAGGYGQGGIFPDKYNAANIICHDQAKPGEGIADVKAGSTVSVYWTKWAESHHGPVLDYLAPCSSSCTAVSPSALSFTKIAESGLITPGNPSSYVFASDALIKHNSTWNVKIPAGLKNGEYVLRTEIIALHAAGTVGGAQNYPQCFNLRVTGGGHVSLPQGLPATKFYKPDMRGIVFNIAGMVKSYPIPGPPLWKGAG